MTKPKVNSTHGGRGPQPQTFDRWVAAAAKRGAKRFRVHLADTTVKLVAHKNAPDSTKRMLVMMPVRVEAIDDKDAELGEWTFPEVEGQETDELPGYLKEEGDTEDERVLKTFAHLLADAHRIASRQLVEVVATQSKYFAEERKNLLQLQLTSERLLAKRLRGMPRLRVAGEGEETEGAEDEAEDDTFLQDLLGPVVRKMAMRMAGQMTGEANAEPNGQAKEKTS